MTKPPETFEALLREVLPWIDEHLETSGTAVQERPLAAARQLVDHFVLAIEGDTKDNYLVKPWFAGIFQPVYKWYERRYGQALTRPRQASVRGLVSHFATPCLIRVPLVLAEPNED